MMPRGEGAIMLAKTVGPGAPQRDHGSHAEQGRSMLFRRQFTSTDTETRATLQAMMLALDQAGIGAEDASNVELILAEALNNVAEHAYSDGAGPVDLLVSIQRNGLVCTISDRGRPMPSGVAPSPDLPTISPPDELPEGGFGWHIIRCLTSELVYARDQGRNLLSMRIPWSGFD